MSLKKLEFDYHQLAEDNQAIGIIKVDEKGIFDDDWNGRISYTDRHELHLIEKDSFDALCEYITKRIYKKRKMYGHDCDYDFAFSLIIDDIHKDKELVLSVTVEGIALDNQDDPKDFPVLIKTDDPDIDCYHDIDGKIYYNEDDQSDLIEEDESDRSIIYKNVINFEELREYTDWKVMNSHVDIIIYSKNDELRNKIKDHFMKYVKDIRC